MNSNVIHIVTVANYKKQIRRTYAFSQKRNAETFMKLLKRDLSWVYSETEKPRHISVSLDTIWIDEGDWKDEIEYVRESCFYEETNKNEG